MVLWLYAVYINKIDLLPSLIVNVPLGNFFPALDFTKPSVNCEQHSEVFKLPKGLEMAKKKKKSQSQTCVNSGNNILANKDDLHESN